MNTSEQINELAAALAKAQGMMDNAVMNRVNPHFKSKYADLAAIFDAARKPLSANGLAIVQTIGNGVLHTRLLHTSGQWIASEHPLPTSGRPQEIGSALTYARRYSLSALIGMAADEDDDATAAEKAHKAKGNGPQSSDEFFISPEQVTELKKLLDNDENRIARLCAVENIDEIGDIPASSYNSVVNKIIAVNKKIEEKEMQQGSEEWKLARTGSLGASVFHDIIARTKTGYSASRANRKAAMVLEIITGRPTETYQSQAMIDGIEREPMARAAYAWAKNIDVEEVGLIRHPIARTHVSPDGLVGSNGIIEIKCLQPAGHLDMLLTGSIDIKHATQMAWAMACTGRSYCDFICYSPDFPKGPNDDYGMQLIIKRIQRDDAIIAELEKAAREFITEVENTVATLRQRYAIEAAA